jgi:erythromycin esterase-like protein
MHRAISGDSGWMWRNTEVVEFVEWLRHWNAKPDRQRARRFFGIATEILRKKRLERAIGVIYRPESERLSHYFEACLPPQFDAVIHLDETRALQPLERTSEWDAGKLPETYPTTL